MNIFKTYHPFVNFIYFVLAIIFSSTCSHPVYIAISFISAFSYMILLKSKLTAVFIPMIIILSVFYPLFNHQGATILTYLPDGNPLTKESIIYGFASSVMQASTLCWFICCTKVLTTDKLMCIFGKIHPSLSLVLSMLLRFVPRFTAQLKRVLTSQKGIYKKKLTKKLKTYMNVISIMITWAAESAIDISDCMKSRGYGLSKRTSFSLYTFKKRDAAATSCILICGICIAVMFNKDYRYFPLIDFSVNTPVLTVVYALFCTLPCLMEIYGTIRWNMARNIE